MDLFKLHTGTGRCLASLVLNFARISTRCPRCDDQASSRRWRDLSSSPRLVLPWDLRVRRPVVSRLENSVHDEPTIRIRSTRDTPHTNTRAPLEQQVLILWKMFLMEFIPGSAIIHRVLCADYVESQDVARRCLISLVFVVSIVK